MAPFKFGESFNPLEVMLACLGLTESTTRRNYILAGLSGVLFAVSWWLAIDVMAVYSQKEFDHRLHVIPLLGSTSLVLVNLVSNEGVKEDSATEHSRLKRNALRLFLLFSLVLGFGSMAATVFFAVQHYLVEGRRPLWPGISFLLQNVLILAASLIFRFGRTFDSWDIEF